MYYPNNVDDHDSCHVLGNILIDNAVNAFMGFEGEKLFRFSIEIDENVVSIKRRKSIQCSEREKKTQVKGSRTCYDYYKGYCIKV